MKLNQNLALSLDGQDSQSLALQHQVAVHCTNQARLDRVSQVLDVPGAPCPGLVRNGYYG